MFYTFLEQGFLHILDIKGLDHLLFLLVLVLSYSEKDWKKILWILTAFTIAHSLTLILAVYDIISFNAAFVEIGIAASILYTSVENLFFKKFQKHRILIAGFFGLIHGMGFSRLLKELFSSQSYNPFETLLAFNIGIELAQILIVAVILTLFYFIKILTKWNMELINKMISIGVAIQSIVWIFERVN